jgi:3-oxoacyl-[acyl-carrier protein] reductase
MQGLAGKVVLITGAAGAGIGQATARRCAEEGCTVVITDIHPRRTQEVTRALAAIHGSRILSFVMDIADRKQVDNVFAEVIERCGRIDVLVNNAAINLLAGLTELRPEDWDHVVNVDLSAIYYCMRQVLPGMIVRKSGSIINVASVAAWSSGKDEAAYSACKAGMLSLSRSVAVEYGPFGIRCNVVAPGLIRSAFVDKYIDRYQQLAQSSPARRIGERDLQQQRVAHRVAARLRQVHRQRHLLPAAAIGDDRCGIQGQQGSGHVRGGRAVGARHDRPRLRRRGSRPLWPAALHRSCTSPPPQWSASGSSGSGP